MKKIGEIKKNMIKVWQKEWDDNKIHVFIGGIKDKIGEWKWAYSKNRIQETLFARLRCGCARTNKYYFKIKMINSPNCDTCGIIEDIEHVLIHCTNFTTQRNTMIQNLRNIDVTNINLKNLLGGNGAEEETQRKIINIVYRFLTATNLSDKL